MAQGAKQTKDEYAAYGKKVKEQIKASNATAAALAALSESKKAQAAITRRRSEKGEGAKGSARLDRRAGEEAGGEGAARDG